jgi:hypothetical protein
MFVFFRFGGVLCCVPHTYTHTHVCHTTLITHSLTRRRGCYCCCTPSVACVCVSVSVRTCVCVCACDITGEHWQGLMGCREGGGGVFRPARPLPSSPSRGMRSDPLGCVCLCVCVCVCVCVCACVRVALDTPTPTPPPTHATRHTLGVVAKHGHARGARRAHTPKKRCTKSANHSGASNAHARARAPPCGALVQTGAWCLFAKAQQQKSLNDPPAGSPTGALLRLLHPPLRCIRAALPDAEPVAGCPRPPPGTS